MGTLLTMGEGGGIGHISPKVGVTFGEVLAKEIKAGIKVRATLGDVPPPLKNSRLESGLYATKIKIGIKVKAILGDISPPPKSKVGIRVGVTLGDVLPMTQISGWIQGHSNIG